MKDNLEQLVKKHRDSFDDKEPSSRVWQRIARKLDGNNSYQWVWKVAAVVFFITSIGLGAQLTLIKADEQKLAQADLADTDFESVENYYIELISEKRSMIYDFEEKNVTVNQDFEQDLQKLDAMYQVLKEELAANPSKQVVDALILNLLVRIDILNEELQELDPNTSEEEQDGNVNV